MIYIDDSCDKTNQHFTYFANTLSYVTVGDYQLWLCESARGGHYIQIRFEEKDNFSSDDSKCTQYCREWLIRPNMDVNQLVRTAYKAYEAAVIHEMQEKFLFHDQAIFNPHNDVLKLLDKTKV